MIEMTSCYDVIGYGVTYFSLNATYSLTPLLTHSLTHTHTHTHTLPHTYIDSLSLTAL